MRAPLIRRLMEVADAKLGRCPFCMRASLYGSLASWAVFAGFAALWPAPLSLMAALTVASAFSLLAAAHLVVHAIRVDRWIRTRRSQEGIQAPDQTRRAILASAVRSTAAFALVSALGTRGRTAGAAQDHACQNGDYRGTAGAGNSLGCDLGCAERSARERAELEGESHCGALVGCPSSKPTCEGKATVSRVDCHATWGFGPICYADYQCHCKCG